MSEEEGGKYKHLPELGQASGLSRLHSPPPAHLLSHHHHVYPSSSPQRLTTTGGGFVLCLCKIHSRCNQLLTHAPAKLRLPGTSEHFTRAIKSTRECKAPANSTVPFSLSYPIHFSPFNSQEGFYQHSNLCWSAVLTYHILSDIIIWFLEGRTPNLMLSRVSQTQTTMY